MKSNPKNRVEVKCASLTLKVSWAASSWARFKYRSKVTTAPPSDSSVIVGVEADTAQYGLGGGALDIRETQSHGELSL